MFSEPHGTENEQWAHTFIVLFCLFVRLITSRCQFQGSGAAGLKECPSNAQAAWKQRAASWPWLPLGFRSPGRIRDTLTDSLSCVHAHTHSVNRSVLCRVTRRHTDKYTRAYVHALFLHICTCAHMLASRPAHMISHVCAHRLDTLHIHILYIHTHADPKAPNPNKHLASCRRTESLFQFFFFFLCYSGIVTMPTACHLRCCLKVTVTCSHCRWYHPQADLQ